LADARPRFIGHRSVSIVLSQVWAHDASLEGAVMILPWVNVVEVTIEREMASMDSV